MKPKKLAYQCKNDFELWPAYDIDTMEDKMKPTPQFIPKHRTKWNNGERLESIIAVVFTIVLGVSGLSAMTAIFVATIRYIMGG